MRITSSSCGVGSSRASGILTQAQARGRPYATMFVAAFCSVAVRVGAQPSLSPQARQYLWARGSQGVQATWTVREANKNVAALRGRAVELQGKIAGISSLSQPEKSEGDVDRTVSFLLVTSGSESVFVHCESGIAEVACGAHVVVLAKVPEAATSLSFLQLLEIVPQGEIPGQILNPPKPPQAQPAYATGTRSPVAQSPRQMTYHPALPPVPRTGATSNSQRPPLTGWSTVEPYRRLIRSYNPRLTDSELDRIVRQIFVSSARYGVDRRLVVAMIKCESDFYPRCTSHKGAMGLGQLMPCNTKDLGVTDPYNIEQNIEASVRLLASHLKDYIGRSNWEQFALAMACYNAGPGAVAKYGGIPPYRETINYINKVGRLFLSLYQQGYP